MISRNPIAPPRPVPSGFGWIDHRFLRDGHICRVSREAIALYLLLVLAADSNGISFYGDRLIRHLLGFSQPDFENARGELVSAGLVAWEKPVYQLLELAAGRR